MKAYASPRIALLEKIRCALNHDDQQWADALGLSKRQYKRAFKDGATDLPSSAFSSICGYLGLNPSQIYRMDIDVPLLVKHFYGDKTPLPERYAAGAFGTMRTSINILNYTSSVFGAGARSALLSSIRMKEDAFSNPCAPMSIRMVTDLLDALREIDATDSHIYLTGAYSSITNANTGIAALLREYDDPRALYSEFFSEHVAIFERNYDYRLLNVTDDYCIVSSVSHEEASDALHTKHIGSSSTCLLRAGVMSTKTAYSDLPHAAVTEYECVFHGAPECKFVINYRTAAAHAFASRGGLRGRFINARRPS